MVARRDATGLASMRWTADRLDQLERAVRDGLRVALTTRKGTEYVVAAVRIATGLAWWRPVEMLGREPRAFESYRQGIDLLVL